MSEQPTNPDPEDRFANPLPGQFANEPVNGADNEFDDLDNDRDDGSAGDPGSVYEFPRRSGPRREDGSVFDGPVIEGEVVEDPVRKPGTALVLRRAGTATRHGTVRVLTTARTVATHPHTKRTSKAVGRHVWYPMAGLGVVVKQWRDAHGANRYERMMHQAEVAGDREMLLEWEQRDVTEKQRRHDRVMDWVHSPIELVRAIAVGIAAFAGLLLGLGIILAVADSDISLVLAPISAVVDAIAFTVWFLTVYGATLLLLATGGGLLFLWHTGRTYTEPPPWMAQADQAASVREVIPDEGAILNALRNLNLAALNRKFKEGWVPRWVLATGRDGKGYRTQLELPPGVTVEMINNQKAVLAHNLVRLPVEVWPTEPKKQPGVLDLWVADQGILTNPVEPYPLLTDGDSDYFKGVPAGVDQRGEVVTGKLMAANYAAAGTMGSGKTSLVIELLCGAMLDPLVDIDVYVMAYNIDYDPMRDRLRTLVKGDEDEQIKAALDALRDLRDEVTERGKLLAELGGDDPKLTRELAERDPRMRPRVVVFDECHELFMHKKYGEEAAELAIKVMKKARKLGITLIWVTVSPTADSIPKDVTRNTSHRAAFAVGDHVANDRLLGTGKHKAGITATTLSPSEDVGTTLTVGFTKNTFELLRTYYVRKDASTDQVTPVVQRALALREGVTPSAPAVPAGEPIDHLADINQVLGEHELMRTQEVLQRLAAHNLREYGTWTFTELRRVLDPHGAVRKVSVMVVDRAKVREALTHRTTDTDTIDAADATESDTE